MRTRRAITDNTGRLGTIYERLRKRDYRSHRGSFLPWSASYHAGYVAGVGDALGAVAAVLGNPDK